MNKQVAFAPSLREAAFDVTKLNAENFTVEVVWSTGAPVKRSKIDWDAWQIVDFIEELDMSAGAVDMSRLSSGTAPVLDTHNNYSVRDDQVGVVDKAWIADGIGRALLRFSQRDDVKGLWQDIAGGIVRNVSIGYDVDKWEIIKEEGKLERWVARHWMPAEISMVPMGADPEAGLRNAPDLKTRAKPERVTRAEIINRATSPTLEETAMTKPVAPASTVEEPVENLDNRTAAEEHSWSVKDMEKIQARAKAFGLDATVAMDVMRTAKTLDEATDALQAEAVKAQPKRTDPRVEITRDEGDTLRGAIETAILHRANPSAVKLDDAARQWRGMSLLEMGRTYIEETQGVRLRNLSRMDVARAALGLTRAVGMQSTSDFPIILANSISKRLRDTYLATVQTWKPIARQSNAPDLKERSIVALSGMPNLVAVKEGAEYTYARFGESKEVYALAKYGRIIAMTDEMMINDDLGAFDRMPTLFGRAAGELESDIVWGVITGNPTMGDGYALFDDTNHGNLATSGAAISETTLDTAEQAMGVQNDAAGKPMNLRPRFLAVPPKHKVAAQKILTAVSAIKTSEVNVYQNSMDLIVEQRLKPANGNQPWYVVADPAQWDTIEYAYLDGQEGIETSTRIGFEVDGLEVKGRLFFAAKAIDYRGFYKNAGT